MSDLKAAIALLETAERSERSAAANLARLPPEHPVKLAAAVTAAETADSYAAALVLLRLAAADQRDEREAEMNSRVRFPDQ
jgi:hypothetical protein